MQQQSKFNPKRNEMNTKAYLTPTQYKTSENENIGHPNQKL